MRSVAAAEPEIRRRLDFSGGNRLSELAAIRACGAVDRHDGAVAVARAAVHLRDRDDGVAFRADLVVAALRNIRRAAGSGSLRRDLIAAMGAWRAIDDAFEAHHAAGQVGRPDFTSLIGR